MQNHPLHPPEAALDRAAVLAALRARTARLEGAGRARPAESVPVCDALNLPGGGLARGALHEVQAASPGAGAGFCAVLLGRTGGSVLWIATGREAPSAWPPGLARHGLLPANLVLVRAEREADALWAMEESLRCPAVTGVLLALAEDSRLDLTATRRLQLAAETGGGLGLLLRPEITQAEPSAATTRWRVASLHNEGGLEDPCWQLELLRAKAGPPAGPWAVTWRAAAGRLDLEKEAPVAGRAAR